MLAMLLLALTAAAPCESLQTLALSETTILSATAVPEGSFTPPTAAPTAKPVSMPAACRVVGRVPPAVNFEVWMPVSGWNGKFQAVDMPRRPPTPGIRRRADRGRSTIPNW